MTIRKLGVATRERRTCLSFCLRSGSISSMMIVKNELWFRSKEQ